MDTGTLQGIGTLLAITAFTGVCIWAWSDKRKADFEEAANLPFADDTAPTPSPNRDQENAS